MFHKNFTLEKILSKNHFCFARVSLVENDRSKCNEPNGAFVPITRFAGSPMPVTRIEKNLESHVQDISFAEKKLPRQRRK